MLYNIVEPIDDIFNIVNALRRIVKSVNLPYTAYYMVDLGYTFLRKLSIFHPEMQHLLCCNPAN